MDLEEKKEIGREVAQFIYEMNLSREQFAQQAGIGRSTLDKLVTGLFSQKSLDRIAAKTGFVRNNAYAAQGLGQYSKLEWDQYLGNYLLLWPSLSGKNAIDAVEGLIAWDNGMVLWQRPRNKPKSLVGRLTIPHRRSPFIYIQEGARMLMVSTMVGERIMRGMMVSAYRVVANAYVPVAVPIVLIWKKETDIRKDDLGSIASDHIRYEEYKAEIQKVISTQYARFVGVT